jgi:hypothetical protein
MSEPILCEYLLKLATEPSTRERFTKLSCEDRKTFLINLGLHEEAACALAEFNDEGIKNAVVAELKAKGGVPTGPHHTIQMSLDLIDSLTTQDK